MDLEERLSVQLGTAARREERRGRLGRLAAAARAGFRPRRAGAALAVGAAAVAAAAAIVSLTDSRPAPGETADRIALPSAHLAAGTAGFGSLWAYDDASGQVVRIDPRSHGVVARLSVPSPLADVAIATGPDAVWAVPMEPIRHNGGAAPLARPVTAVRIDPRTNRVAARVTLRAPAAGGATARANLRPAGIVSRPDAVWVWGESGAMKIDPARGRVVSVVGVPGKRIMGFAAAGAQVSLATDLDELISFDARSGARRASIPIDAPTVRGTLAAVGGSVVMSQPGGKLASVDPVTGRELWVAHLGSLPRDLVLTGGRLWALIADPATGRGVLLGLDPGDGRTLVRIPLPAADARTLAGGGQTPVVTTQGGELLLPRPTR